MNIKNVFILGAGYGTRMGSVGTILPKILWPVFEKTLLELQVNYAKSLGAERIFVNTHYQAQKIQEYITINKIPVEVSYEKEILDVGGGIHQVAQKLNYSGELLVLNGDQFLFLKAEELEEAQKKIQNKRICLFSIELENLGYNEISIDSFGNLSHIQKGLGVKVKTYAGVSLINLQALTKKTGISNFFESVANYKQQEVKVIFTTSPYLDFGSTKRYVKSLFEILQMESSSSPYLFFLNNNALREDKINRESRTYGATQVSDIVNLGLEMVKEKKAKEVVILKDTHLPILDSGVYYEGFFSPL